MAISRLSSANLPPVGKSDRPEALQFCSISVYHSSLYIIIYLHVIAWCMFIYYIDYRYCICDTHTHPHKVSHRHIICLSISFAKTFRPDIPHHFPVGSLSCICELGNWFERLTRLGTCTGSSMARQNWEKSCGTMLIECGMNSAWRLHQERRTWKDLKSTKDRKQIKTGEEGHKNLRNERENNFTASDGYHET